MAGQKKIDILKTDSQIKNLIAPEKRKFIPIANGYNLYLRASPISDEIKSKKDCNKVFVIRYKFQGKSKTMTLGTYGANENNISLSEAINLSTEAHELRKAGIDPIQHKKDKKEAEERENLEKGTTIKQLSETFYTLYVMEKRKVPEQILQHLETDIVGELLNIEANKHRKPNQKPKVRTKNAIGKMKVVDVIPMHLTKILDEIVARNAKVHAKKVLSTMKQMFSFAERKGYREDNPAIKLKADDYGGTEVERDRKLSLQEIKALWSWLDNKDNYKMNPAFPIALKILLLIGCRSGELRLAKWQEIDFDNSLWTIPVEHMKTGRKKWAEPHKIHLTRLVKSLFKELKTLSNCEYILPSPIVKKDVHGKELNSPVEPKSLARAVARLHGRITLDSKAIEAWTPHDLRRTFRTQLSALKVPPYVAEKCLCHRLDTILETYDHHDYLEERKEALELWSKKIEELVNNDNVIPFEKKQG